MGAWSALDAVSSAGSGTLPGLAFSRRSRVRGSGRPGAWTVFVSALPAGCGTLPDLALSGRPRVRGSRRAAAWSVLGAALLAGCGTLPDLVPSEREAAWRAHASALSHFQSWTVTGRLVVRSRGEASRVAMRWRQTRGAYLVRLTAPFGAGLFEVERSAAGVEARFADGRRVRAASPEALLEREVGWSVPLWGLRYWIAGAVAPGGTPERIELDGRGRLARLEQAGWTVVYERYGQLGDLALPERIRLTGPSVTATVALRQWTAGR